MMAQHVRVVPGPSVPRSGRPAATSLLYLCYLGITEPLVQTQVIPYLEGLAAAGWGPVLLTFEPRPLMRDAQNSAREALGRRGIEWRSLRYHKRPALPATFADVVLGIVYGAYLARTRRVAVVHARGHVPAAMALGLKWLVGTRFVFDIRGLVADEYVDAGLWRPGGVLYRAVKWMERFLLARAAAAVVLTGRARAWLCGGRESLMRTGSFVEIVPCCVNLARFRVDRLRTRNIRLGLGLDRHPVLVYAGKLGGWYMAGEMADFFCVAKRFFPRLRFLVLTQGDSAIMREEFERKGVARDEYRCVATPPEETPAYLALADFAISFIAPAFSKMASSPTKMGEYLAAGLPVVYNAGIGDLDDLEREGVGARLEAFSEAEYIGAADRIRTLLEERDATSQSCRTAAERHFSLAGIGIPRYVRLYARLAGAQLSDTAAVADTPQLTVDDAVGAGTPR